MGLNSQKSEFLFEQLQLLHYLESERWVCGTQITMLWPDLKLFSPQMKKQKKEIYKKEWWQNQQGLIAIWGGGFSRTRLWKRLTKNGTVTRGVFGYDFCCIFRRDRILLEICFFFALYMGLFFTVLKQLSQVRDPQLKTLAIGIISLIIVQVFVHIGVNLEILPNTGLTLPFVSHGGTALMINLIELALLYKILRGK